MATILLAALAAVGLFALLWLGFGRLLVPAAGIHLLVPVHGDGGDLEHNLKGLRWPVSYTQRDVKKRMDAYLAQYGATH